MRKNKGNHTLVIFQSNRTLRRSVTRLIRERMDRGDSCLVIFPTEESAAKQKRFDTDGNRASKGRLSYVFVGREPKAGQILEIVRRHITAACKIRSGLSLCVDMSYISDDEGADLESELDELSKRQNLEVFCLYSRDRSSEKKLLSAIRSNPKIMVSGEPEDNFYYLPRGAIMRPEEEAKIYLDNLSKYKRSEISAGHRLKDQTLLSDLTTIAGKSYDINETIREMLSRIVKLPELTAGMVHFLEDDGRLLRLKASQGLALGIVNELETIETAGSTIGKTVRSGQVTIVKKATAVTLRKTPRLAEQLKSVAMIPIAAGDKVSGVLTVGSESETITDRHLPVLIEIGRKLGLAGQRSGLKRELIKRIDELKIVNEIGRSLASTLDIKERADIICKGLLDIAQVDNCFIGLMEPDKKHIEIVAAAGKNSEELPGMKAALRHIRLFEDTIKTNQATIVNDATTDKRISPEIRERIKQRSCACLPLITREKTIGIVTISYIVEKHYFDPDELERIAPTVDQAAAMLDNARLFAEIGNIRDQYSDLFNQSTDIIYTIDNQGIIKEFSPAVERIAGYKPGDLTGKKFTAFLEPEEIPRAKALFADLLAGREVNQPVELKFRDINGDTVIYEIVSRRTGSDKDALISGIARDITQKKKAEVEMRRRNSELDAVYKLGLKMGQSLDIRREAGIFLDHLDEINIDVRATLFFIDESRTTLSLIGSKGLVEGKKLKLPIGTDYIRFVCQLDTECANLPDSSRIMFSVPMIVEGELIGLLCGIKSDLQPLSEAERRSLDILLAQAARIFRNIDKQRQLERANLALKRSASELHALSVADSEFLRINEVNQYLKLLASEAVKSMQPSEAAVIIKLHVEDETWLGFSDNVPEGTAVALEIPEEIGGDLRRNILVKKNKLPETLLEGMKALLAAPVTFESNLVGFLAIFYPEPQDVFPPENETLAESLSHQTSQFITRIMSEKRLKEETKISSTLLQISTALNSQMNQEVMLRHLCQTLPGLIKCSRGAVLLFDKYLNRFVPAAWQGFSEDLIPKIKKLNFGAADIPAIGYMDKLKRAVIVDDETDGLIPKELMQEFAAKRVLMTPLVANGRLTGVIMLDQPGQKHRFTAKDVSLIEAVAKELVVVLDNLTLYQNYMDKTMDLAKKLEMISVMHDIDLAILSAMDEKQIIATICTNARQLVSCDQASIYFYDQDSNLFTLKSASSAEHVKQEELNKYVSGADSLAFSAIIKGRPYYSPDLAGEQGSRPADIDFLNRGVHSLLAVPLMLKNEIIGCLLFSSNRAVAFDYSDMRAAENLSLQTSVALKNVRLLDRVEFEAERLRRVYDVTKDIFSELSLEFLPKKIAIEAMKLIRAKYCAVRLVDEKMNTTAFMPVGIPPEQTRLIGGLPQGQGLLNVLVRDRKPLRLADLTEHPESYGFPANHPIMRTFLGAPIILRDQLLGGVYMCEKIGGEFTKEDEDILVGVASNIAVAIENARLFAKLRSAYLATIMSLAATIEAKDPFFSLAHLERIQKYSVAIAKRLGLPVEEVEAVRTAAYLHDIGKISIPERITLKKGLLSGEEWETVYRHTDVGSEVMNQANFPWEVAPIILSHHERFDGKGYPDGSKGDDIPLGARIISIVDAWDAMRSKRPYRRTLSSQEAREELIKNRGTQFDPVLVDIFLQLLEEESRPSKEAA